MSNTVLLVWFLNILVDTAGHTAFKFAAILDADNERDRWIGMLTNAPIWIGIACFIAEFILWLILLSILPLSMSVLLAAINMAAIVLAGRVFFRERLDPLRLAGLVCIVAGVALVGGAA